MVKLNPQLSCFERLQITIPGRPEGIPQPPSFFIIHPRSPPPSRRGYQGSTHPLYIQPKCQLQKERGVEDLGGELSSHQEKQPEEAAGLCPVLAAVSWVLGLPGSSAPMWCRLAPRVTHKFL
jgi:hypothetical protein